MVTYKKPPASSLLIRDRMRAQRTRDTEAERALRSALFRRGLRFRVNQKLPGLSRKTFDVIFPRQKVAVLVDGCFWHACPIHATWPKANAEWWKNKIEENQRRDLATNEALNAAGWTVVRVWEHVDAEVAAEQVVKIVAEPTSTTIEIT
jgi:DNA mismatch endonuclease, patch repair protein